MTVPIGTILAYGGLVDGNAKGELAKQGWLVCDGEAMSRDDYTELYAVIGGSFGDGDNVKTFNLPDLRGRFLRGVDHGTGHDPDASSRGASAERGNTGDKVGSAQDDEFKAHHHPLPQVVADTGGRYGQPVGSGSSLGLTWPGFNGTPTPNSQDVGGHETRPKNIYVNWIIKAKNV
ncbi:MAG: tail fiber protein [Spirulina sp. SIO3F2]|nr:tail fiber protein [Spirulina sp. SIO3F2]